MNATPQPPYSALIRQGWDQTTARRYFVTDAWVGRSSRAMTQPYGIYAGTIGEREYAHGRDEGRHAADLLAEGGFIAWQSVGEAEARKNLQASNTPRPRAFYLGWLRGFREVSR